VIIRCCFACLTCDRNRVVRIGMGHDDRQVHAFPCRSCGEEMVIALNVDHERIATVPEAVDNARLSQREAVIRVVPHERSVRVTSAAALHRHDT